MTVTFCLLFVSYHAIWHFKNIIKVDHNTDHCKNLGKFESKLLIFSKRGFFWKNWLPQVSMFWEEISACAAVHTCYVMDARDRVRSIIRLPPMMGMSFLLVALLRLIVREPKHWVTWSDRTDVNFPFLREKKIQRFSLST